MNLKIKHPGFTTLELLVTIMLIALVTGAAVDLLNRIRDNSAVLTTQMTRQAALQHCFDIIFDDIMASSDNAKKIGIIQAEVNGLKTAHLSLSTTGAQPDTEPLALIDWLAVARTDFGDLALFRRESKVSDQDAAPYISLCEGLHSFQVELLDPNGVPLEKDGPAGEENYELGPSLVAQPDPNAPAAADQTAQPEPEGPPPPALVRITAEQYMDEIHDPDRLYVVSRTYCLRRFEYAELSSN